MDRRAAGWIVAGAVPAGAAVELPPEVGETDMDELPVAAESPLDWRPTPAPAPTGAKSPRSATDGADGRCRATKIPIPTIASNTVAPNPIPTNFAGLTPLLGRPCSKGVAPARAAVG